jgi:hypothetical protein
MDSTSNSKADRVEAGARYGTRAAFGAPKVCETFQSKGDGMFTTVLQP